MKLFNTIFYQLTLGVYRSQFRRPGHFLRGQG